MAASLPESRKSFRVHAGYQYSYVSKKPRGDKPTFLLVHGFPSSVYDWRKQINDLSAAGYGVIAPDLLGYGETDRPDVVEEYTLSKISAHVTELLDHEGISSVIGVGHDWGSGLLSRLWTNHAEYFSSLVFMSVPYQLPGPLDLDSLNAQTEQGFGYPIFGYWYFFNQSTAAAAIEQKHDSFASIVYPSSPELWKSDFCPVGKLQDWLEGNKSSPRPSWLPEKEANEHSRILLKGGYTGPLNWYKAAIRGIDSENDAKIPQEAIVISKPVWFVVGEFDAISRPEIAFQTAEQYRQSGIVADLDVKIVPSGHWIGVEKPKETFEILDEFARKLAA